jgi:hypothetical protein
VIAPETVRPRLVAPAGALSVARAPPGPLETASQCFDAAAAPKPVCARTY